MAGNTNLDGSVVIGANSSFTATTPFPSGYRLYVADGILTEKVKVAVKSTSDWSDFVFADNYQLRSLEMLGAYIKKHRHLPDVPSAEQVVNEGIDLAKMDALLLQKIEELTLYVLQLKNQNDELQKKVEALEKGN